MKHLFTFIIGAALATGSVHALEIKVTKAGSLEADYGSLCNTRDISLKLSGEADVRDLALLKDMSKTIAVVDMSELVIKAYNYTDGSYMGLKNFEDGELPPYIMAGSSIKSINLPRSLKKIGASAFMASQLEKIEFPSALTTIGDYAFANSANLTNATLTHNVTIGVGVFKDCNHLRNVIIEFPIALIPESTFEGCSSYMAEIPSSVTVIGANAYRGTATESADLSNVKTVGDYAFSDIPNLSTIIIGSNRNISLGKGVFFNDGELSDIPSFDTEMSQAVFAHVSAITSDIINSDIIGVGAFANNSKLDTIYFGPNVKTIESHAFRNDNNLKLIDVTALGRNIPEVAEDAFSGLANDEGRYDIDLNVKSENAEDWRKDPVWGLFNIGQYVVGIDEVSPETVASISVTRRGNRVSAESNINIDYIGIFGINGMNLYESTPGTTSVNVEISDSHDVIVVKVISGGIEKILKLK